MSPLHQIDRPFPLKRRFVAWIVPGLILFLGILIFTTYQASRDVIRDIYLQQATSRAEGIAHGVARSHPEEWSMLVNGEAIALDGQQALSNAFNDERREFKLEKLKVYDLSGLTIFSTDPATMGKLENNPALTGVLRTGEPQALIEHAGENNELYELYVPFRENGRLVAVFEIYEPSSYLNTVLGRASLPVILIPGGLFIVMLGALSLLVFRAQHAIDTRTHEVNQLRGRLEGLVSKRAAEAMRRTDDATANLSESVSCTLFYSDIRGFTGFSEAHTPEQVIAFLNDVMGLQIEIVERHGGDVDKLIGDALFARFHEKNKEANAIQAAIEIQAVVRGRGIAPGIGIGIYSGDVIAGGIGRENRRDYTVIGDSVNVSARLCSLAGEGEIVCDVDTCARSGVDGFSEIETSHVKGRKEEIQIRRR